jgi:haloacetate dehalogenase
MFERFEQKYVDTERGRLFVRVGGSGSQVLLLYGYPQSHVMWHAVVDALAGEHTVIVADLPGYGSSLRPAVCMALAGIMTAADVPSQSCLLLA